jgi:hypothetical protein
MLIYSDTATNPDTCGVQEVQLLKSRNRSLYLVEDPTGDYYVTVLDYDAGVDFNYTFLFNSLTVLYKRLQVLSMELLTLTNFM